MQYSAVRREAGWLVENRFKNSSCCSDAWRATSRRVRAMRSRVAVHPSASQRHSSLDARHSLSSSILCASAAEPAEKQPVGPRGTKRRKLYVKSSLCCERFGDMLGEEAVG
jgi:hypothetical protein